MLDMRHEVSDYKKELAVLEKEAEVRIVQLHETSTGDQLNRFVSTDYGQLNIL